jgi:tripartite ATP-independent transporter DctP family solute receptor
MTSNPSTTAQRELSFVVLFSGERDDRSSEVHPIQQAAAMFAEAVERRTNGEITVQVHSVHTLYSQLETLEKAVRGIIDMCTATQGVLDKYVKVFALVMMPFIYDGYDHVYRVLDGPFKEWVAPLLEKEKLVFLADWEWGFRNITNNVRPVNSANDVKGLKLRIPPGEQNLRAVMEACGATVTEIALPDLYEALEQGIVDGEENPVEVIYRFNLYEVQKYLSLTRHVYNCMVHVMNLKAWNKLTPEQQQILTEESQKAGNFLRKAIQTEEIDLLKKLKEKGMEIIISPDIKTFRAMMEPAYKQIGAYIGEENVKNFMEMVNAART